MYFVPYLPFGTCTCTASSVRPTQLFVEPSGKPGKLKEHKEKKCSSRVDVCPEPGHCGAAAHARKRTGKCGWKCFKKNSALGAAQRNGPTHLSALVFSLMLRVVLITTLFFMACLVFNLIGSLTWLTAYLNSLAQDRWWT